MQGLMLDKEMPGTSKWHVEGGSEEMFKWVVSAFYIRQ